MFSFIWKYSRREQITLLAVTTTLFPVLYLTLELPKMIINDAIDASSSAITVLGTQTSQVTYLAILCFGFLGAVFVHGILKMRINTMKGVLAERMLRRFRYSLIARIIRFPQSYFRRTSQGELVSMVTAEAEPLGGLMGDALAQPVLQTGQMLTILSFLFIQNFWFGMAAVALIPLQAWLIPKLQRQINLLNKDRIIEVRKLAAEIGETAAGAGSLRRHGGSRHRMALITDRLGWLFDIRLKIYNKKFFMKFLNNFITQLTPFFFFSIGGYLVIQGSVTLGALVAALAAYKDLSSPWKELLAYYNQVQDMSLRWQVITERFAPDSMLDEKLLTKEPKDIPNLKGDILLKDVTVLDQDGNIVLENLNTRFPGNGTIAIASASEEDRNAMAELLLRELTPTSGTVTVAGDDLSQLHQSVIAARIGHANSRPYIFDGTIGQNVMMPLMARPTGDNSSKATNSRLTEAIRSGNCLDDINENWFDPLNAGLKDEAQVREWWLTLIEGMGSGNALFHRGLTHQFEKERHPELAQRLVDLRPQVAHRIHAAGLDNLFYRFDPDQYHPCMPIAGNLLFATPRENILQTALARRADFLKMLRELDLVDDLTELAQTVIEMFRQTFGLDGTGHPLFRRLGIEPDVYQKTVKMVGDSRKPGASSLKDNDLALLLSVPFLIPADQIGPAFSDKMKQRILDIRHAKKDELNQQLHTLYAPLDVATFAPGLTVLENAIYGIIPPELGNRAEKLRDLATEVLMEAGLKPLVAQLIYDIPTGLGGSNLSASYVERLAFSRAAIKKPDILVLDTPLASYDPEVRITASIKLREALPETTIIYLEEAFVNPENFDVYIELKHGRITSDTKDLDEGDNRASADLRQKLRALETAELFANLDRRQLRLLAFGARWYEADANETIFHRGDEPKDGAYLILEGEAGLYFEVPGYEDELIGTVGPNGLVGELALIRNERRRLTMRTHTKINALRIGSEEFLAVVENDPETSIKLLNAISSYLSEAADKANAARRSDHKKKE